MSAAWTCNSEVVGPLPDHKMFLPQGSPSFKSSATSRKYPTSKSPSQLAILGCFDEFGMFL